MGTASNHEVVDEHYKNLADNYDVFLKYSPDFVRKLTSKMIGKLALAPSDVFVDLGGGTGIYSADILEQVRLEHPVILVDPFEEMLAHAPDTPRFRKVPMDALTFAAQPGDYDKILIKEAVHHVASDDRPRLFADLRDRLKPGGRLLLVHVPPDLDYPLFAEALERSLHWHANPDELVRQLRGAGFSAERERLVYRHRLPKETYFTMVRARYMSLLTSFDRAELEAGLAEMAKRYQERDILEFDDRFDYLTAVER